MWRKWIPWTVLSKYTPTTYWKNFDAILGSMLQLYGSMHFKIKIHCCKNLQPTVVCVCSLFTYDLYIVFLETQVYIFAILLHLLSPPQTRRRRTCMYVCSMYCFNLHLHFNCCNVYIHWLCNTFSWDNVLVNQCNLLTLSTFWTVFTVYMCDNLYTCVFFQEFILHAVVSSSTLTRYHSIKNRNWCDMSLLTLSRD